MLILDLIGNIRFGLRKAFFEKKPFIAFRTKCPTSPNKFSKNIQNIRRLSPLVLYRAKIKGFGVNQGLPKISSSATY